MITKLAESITAFLIRRSYAGIREKDIVCYGMEVIISTIVGWTMILIVGAVCGNVLYSFVFGVVFLTLRSFTGGYHADTYLKCNMTLVTIFLASLLMEKILAYYCRWYIMEAAFLLDIVVIWKLAPVEHPYKPLGKEQKRRSKKISIVLCTLLAGVENFLWIMGEKEISIMILSVTAVVMILLLIGAKEKRRKEDVANGKG